MALLLTWPAPATAAQSPEALRARIEATSDKETLAGLYKELGEQLIAQDRVEEAADAFTVALDTDRERFSIGERVQMAVYLSWADRLERSAHELRAVLAGEPKHREARAHLARVLSWQGRLAAAIDEADQVLKEYPEDRQAALIKADALQWQGQYREAIALYRQLAAKSDDFDAQIGLSRSFLATGDRVAAVEAFNSLKPAGARQERELRRLAETIDAQTRPTLDARYNYFRDSDRNRLHRYSVAASYWMGNHKLGASFRHTDADDRSRRNRADDFSLQLYSQITDLLAAGAGLGFTQIGNGRTSHFPSGHLRIDTRVFRGSAGVVASREVLSDTAELIENRIRMTAAGLYLHQPLTDRISLRAGYYFKDFSDGNHAHDVQLASQYAFYLNPRIAVGHRFRLLDFRKQSGGGYFDPAGYISNRVFTSYGLERDKYYTYLEVYVGHQTFRRNGVASDDFIHGGAASIGFKPTPAVAVEVNVEGGTFAAGAASGFNYFVIGPRLLFRF